jgi:dUTP pyrophosphatase
MMDVKIKKLVETAIIPKYAHDTDAGLDLTAVSKEYKNKTFIYGTGLAIEIPQGYVGLIFPRSSNYKQDLWLTNCVGVIDSGYRGEIKFMFKDLVNRNDPTYGVYNEGKEWEIGDRIGQLIIMPYPSINLVEVDELSDSDRGEGGFGSTGTK